MLILRSRQVSATFSLVYIYTAEVFPTILRTLGVGVCSLFARIAVIMSPFVASAVSYQKLPEVRFAVTRLDT